MTSPAKAPPHDGQPLERALGLRDLVLFHLVAVIGLRWLATSAKAGPSALALWALAAVFFFVPQGLAVTELSSRFPDEGGIYAWTKRAFGEGHGFLCGWCYWVSNVLYYPNLLISTAAIALYVVGKGEGPLAGDWTYIIATTMLALWVAVALNIVGLGTGKWLQNLGGIGTYVPGVLLIIVGVVAVASRQPSANPITSHNAVPNLTDFGTLNLWASIAFAFAGLELSSTMGDEIKNPARNLPRSIYIAAPLIAIVYIAGTGSLLWLVPTGDINIVSGFLQGISAGMHAISPSLWWVTAFAAACYTLGNIGGVGAWLSGPARVAFVIGLDRYFPPAFGKVHPTWKTPYVAILVQAGLASIFLGISVLGKGTTVEKAYLILLDTQLLVYFIPFLYLFASFVVHRYREGTASAPVHVPGGNGMATLVGASGFVITAFAMIVAMIPPGDTADPWTFRLKVIGGAGGFILVGGAIYWRAQRALARTRSSGESPASM
ncbi:MAG: APC family permease [Gemmatimonadaceae bacterium]